MKFAIAALLLSAASAIDTGKLLKHARRLEQNNQNGYNGYQNGDEEFGFLANYSVKLIQCAAGETFVSPEDGEYEYSSVVFRLCPNDEGCDDEKERGCTKGYGDYVVGINTYLEMYLEDKKDQMQYDDNFNVEEFAECREYEPDNDADDGGNNQNYQFFVGPACTEEGDDIRLQMFMDEGCSMVSETTFEQISNGMSMPYGSGGLVSTYCESCAGYNENGEWELSEMCSRLYEFSGKCETEMEQTGYYGKQEGSCEYIESIAPATRGTGAGKIVGWFFFAVIIVGIAAGGFMYFRKKSSGSAEGTSNSFGLLS